MKIKRIFTNNNNLEEIINSIIEEQVDEKIKEIYNKVQADTVAQISENERRVA